MKCRGAFISLNYIFSQRKYLVWGIPLAGAGHLPPLLPYKSGSGYMNSELRAHSSAEMYSYPCYSTFTLTETKRGNLT